MELGSPLAPSSHSIASCMVLTPAAQQRASSGLDNSTVLGRSLMAGAGRASARGLEGQGRCLGLGTVPRPLEHGTLPIRLSLGIGLEALLNRQRERSGVGRRPLQKAPSELRIAAPKMPLSLDVGSSGQYFCRVKNCLSGKLLPLHFPATVPDVFEREKYVLTFAIRSSDVFPSRPENSPRAVGVEEIGIVFLLGSQLCSVL